MSMKMKLAADDTESGGSTCSVCGASIERDPEGETNRTWHHNDGDKHDHEAKPSGGDSKESRRKVAASLNDLMDFDHPVVSDGNGNVTDAPSNIYAPEVSVDLDDEGQMTSLDPSDIYVSDPWMLLSGFSGQDRYPGPIMHPSEFVGGGLETYIRENPGVYATVVVTGIGGPEEDDDAVGWAVAYIPKESRKRSAIDFPTDDDDDPPPETVQEGGTASGYAAAGGGPDMPYDPNAEYLPDTGNPGQYYTPDREMTVGISPRGVRRGLNDTGGGGGGSGLQDFPDDDRDELYSVQPNDPEPEQLEPSTDRPFEEGGYLAPVADYLNRFRQVPASKRTAADDDEGGNGGQTCSVCGSSIERDPPGEEPRTWHHNDGESHDHEAKPSGGDKESRKRAVTEFEVQGNYGQGWEMVTTEETKEAADEQKRTYDENEPGTPHRVKRVEARRKVAAEEVPDDYPVKVLKPGTEAYRNAKDLTTCGTCGRSWDDAVITGMTPAPSARCPFEYYHDYDDDDDDGYYAMRKGAAQWDTDRIGEGIGIVNASAIINGYPCSVHVWNGAVHWAIGAGDDAGSSDLQSAIATDVESAKSACEAAVQALPPGPLPGGTKSYYAMRKGAPFADYKDFADCVAKNGDKDDPEAYCGKIKHQVEDSKSSAKHECVYSQETVHSDDILAVYHGHVEPTYVCGYHEMRWGVPGSGRYEKETGHKAKIAGNPHEVGTPAWFRWEYGEGDPASYGPSSGIPKDLFPEGGVPLHGDLTPEQEAWMKSRKRSRKTAISLTNVGIDGPGVGIGTDPSGNRVKFRLSEKDEKDLKGVLYSDLAVNFSGVDIDEGDIIKGSRKQAEHKTEGPYKVQVAGSGENVWSENALRFDTPEEAKAYASDLLGRWFGADMARVVSSDTPTRAAVDPSDSQIVINYRTGMRRRAMAQISVHELKAGDVLVTPDGQIDRQNNRVAKVDGFSGMWVIDFTNGTSTPPLGNGMVTVLREAQRGRVAVKSRNCENGNHSICTGSSCTCSCHKKGTAKDMSGACGEGDHDACQMSHGLGDDDCQCPVCRNKTARRTAARSLSEIASEIRRDWKSVEYSAAPYLDAMRQLDSINDNYGADSAKSIVAYFLVNASKWRGETAKRIKAELRAMGSKQAGRKTAWNYYLDMIEDSNGDLVDIDYYHNFCAPPEVKEKGGWPAPEWPDYDVYCAGCGELIHEGLSSEGRLAVTEDSDEDEGAHTVRDPRNPRGLYGGDRNILLQDRALELHDEERRRQLEVEQLERAGARSDYAHWNEDQDYMWYQEEGRFAEEPPEYDDDPYDGPTDEGPEIGDEDICEHCGDGITFTGNDEWIDSVNSATCSDSPDHTHLPSQTYFMSDEAERAAERRQMGFEGTARPFVQSQALFGFGDPDKWGPVKWVPGTPIEDATPVDIWDEENDKEGALLTQAMPNPADYGVQPGDIFHDTWGYDQTNVDWYEVTGLTGASVRMRPIAHDYIEDRAWGDDGQVDASPRRVHRPRVHQADL